MSCVVVVNVVHVILALLLLLSLFVGLFLLLWLLLLNAMNLVRLEERVPGSGIGFVFVFV